MHTIQKSVEQFKRLHIISIHLYNHGEGRNYKCPGTKPTPSSPAVMSRAGLAYAGIRAVRICLKGSRTTWQTGLGFDNSASNWPHSLSKMVSFFHWHVHFSAGIGSHQMDEVFSD